MPFKFNTLLRAILAGSGGGSVAVALRYASALNYRCSVTRQATATRRKMWVRVKVVIGTNDFSSLKLRFQSSYFAAGGDNSVGNDYYIEQCAFEKETGGAAHTPVLFSGGRTATVTSGSGGLLSDAILPASFGLGAFTRGHVYWIRLLASVTSETDYFPVGGVVGTGGAAIQFNPVTTGVSAVDSTGAPNYTPGTGGSGPSDYSFGSSIAPILLGSPVLTTGKYICALGDSIVNGVGDTPVGGGWVSGFTQRALFDADFASNPFAGCNLSFSGSSAVSMWVGALTETKAILAHGNISTEEWGTNSPTYSASAAVWGDLRTLGHTVVRTKLLTQTTSTDAWATTVNQTKTANYTTPTGNRIVFNNAIAAQEGILYDKFVSFDSAVLHTDRDLWKAPSYTTDGLHPSATAHEAMAVVMRAAYAALP